MTGTDLAAEREDGRTLPGGAPLVPVGDPQDPRVAGYMNLKDAFLRFQAGLPDTSGRFIAEGEKVVAQLLSSPYRVESVLLSPGRLDAMRPRLDGLDARTPVYVAEREVMRRIAGIDLHRGVLALGLRGAEHAWRETLASARAAVVLEDTANHDNVGGVFRSVSALVGAGACVLLNHRACDPLYRKAIRVSMGRVLHVPWARIAPWPDALDEARALGFEPLALTPDPAAADIRTYAVPPGRRPMLMVGSEGPGLTDAAMARATPVRIDIDPAADSLNASVAAAVALHRLVECRPTGPHAGENLAQPR